MTEQPIARRGQVTINYASPIVFKFASRLPGYKKFLDTGGLIFQATKHHVDLYRDTFPEIPIVDADGTIADIYREVSPIIDSPRLLDLNPNLPPPAAHQNRAHNIMMARTVYAFFHDMGTYKSGTITQGIGELFARDKIEQAVIVCNSGRSLPQFMVEQFPMWIQPDISYKAARIPSTQAKKALVYPDGDLLVAFTTPGAFQSTRQSQLIKDFCKRGKTGLFIDESQNFKGWSTNRVDNMLKLVAPHTVCRFLFSGEPQPNGLEDLFAQFYVLDSNIIGHATKQSFSNQYCVFGGYQLSVIVDYKNKEELASRIAPHCEYLKITDCIDMPTVSFHTAIFEPVQQQFDLYDQLKQEARIEIERALNSKDTEFIRRTCKNAASKFTVMAQVSNGWFYEDLVEEDEPRKIVPITDNRALFVLEDLVGSLPKCIVWARFHNDLEQIKRCASELKIPAVEFSGRIKDAQCEANKLAFQHDPKIRLFYGTAESGGESLNLQVASRDIFYSNSYNWGKRNQAERRTWRGGQGSPCQHWDVIGLPIDRMIRRNAMEKKDLSSQMRLAVDMARLLDEI